MKWKTITVITGILLAAQPARAHFQLLYTPKVNVTKAGDIPVKLIFWHPFENGHVMDMETPEDFHMVFKGEKTNLKNTLKPIAFQGASNTAGAFEATVPVKRNGDYVLALTPSPYYEKSEGIYIQQITKSFINKGGVPSGWNKPIGLATEIVPLNKPTNIIAGSTFSGVVLAEGEPVAGAEIEVEYLASAPDMRTNKAAPATVAPPPGGIVMAIADANGVFTFGVPKAGFWGFAALGTGSTKEFKGKELSQDAVVWIRAFDLK